MSLKFNCSKGPLKSDSIIVNWFLFHSYGMSLKSFSRHEGIKRLENKTRFSRLLKRNPNRCIFDFVVFIFKTIFSAMRAIKFGMHNRGLMMINIIIFVCNKISLKCYKEGKTAREIAKRISLMLFGHDEAIEVSIPNNFH